MNRETKPVPGALAKMEESVARDPLRPETPAELVDEELREAGGDPERIRRDGGDLAKLLLERRRTILRDRAKADLGARREKAERAPRIPRDSREFLLRRIAEIERDPRYGGQVTAMFRNRAIAETSNDELATLLEEIEAARLADEER